MDTQNKTQNIFRSILSGVGIAGLRLVIGAVLDYAVTQILSQFFIANCSETVISTSLISYLRLLSC